MAELICLADVRSLSTSNEQIRSPACVCPQRGAGSYRGAVSAMDQERFYSESLGRWLSAGRRRCIVTAGLLQGNVASTENKRIAVQLIVFFR